jgi:HKD family nuclease
VPLLKLVLQGLTERTHAEVLGEIFGGELERAIVCVAFVSEDGVDLIEPILAPYADKTTVFAGIRNEITSAQALKRLLDVGVSLYAVDTGSRTLLFHPKLYYVRAGETAQLSIGSANLTLGGLNNNIEAGVLLALSLEDEDDDRFVKDLEKSLDKLATDHPQNVFKLPDKATIDELLNAGRLIDETAAPPARTATKAKAGSVDLTPRMKTKPTRLRGKTKSKAPPVPTPAQAPAAPPPGASAPRNAPGASATVAPDLELVWESKPLSRRSLVIPINPKSNPTGSTTLGSGTFDDIDRVTYFRNDLFGHLAWTLKGTIETATQEFDLVIKGVLVGTFDLTLRHSLTRAAAAPSDHNSPTGLSWNRARALIAREDLLERTMRIWRSTEYPTEFQIEID